ncbi:hypothetical protein C8R44DRAFT_883050 [Mycena epipterygia]|nr:hypothetical protein C8R44DRAFT_883050 [Mycena epipterygia]
MVRISNWCSNFEQRRILATPRIPRSLRPLIILQPSSVSTAASRRHPDSEFLSALPLLQRLEISDHRLFQDRGRSCGAKHLFITDILFSALTLESTPPSVVPHLCSVLICQSFLQIDEHVYLDFLLSRRCTTSSDLPPFVSELQWFPGHHRELDSIVSVRLCELRINKELLFMLSPFTNRALNISVRALPCTTLGAALNQPHLAQLRTLEVTCFAYIPLYPSSFVGFQGIATWLLDEIPGLVPSTRDRDVFAI